MTEIFTGGAAIIQYQSFALNSFDVVQVLFEYCSHLLSLTLYLALLASYTYLLLISYDMNINIASFKKYCKLNVQ
jgi:hypothetical protein